MESQAIAQSGNDPKGSGAVVSPAGDRQCVEAQGRWSSSMDTTWRSGCAKVKGKYRRAIVQPIDLGTLQVLLGHKLCTLPCALRCVQLGSGMKNAKLANALPQAGVHAHEVRYPSRRRHRWSAKRGEWPESRRSRVNRCGRSHVLTGEMYRQIQRP